MFQSRNRRVLFLLPLFFVSLLSTLAKQPAAWHFPHGSIGSLAVRDGYVYVLNGWSRGDGILCFDARNSKKIRFMGGMPGKGYLTQVAFKDSCMYVATKFSLMVFDLQRPDKPRLLRNLLMGFPRMGAMTLAVAGNYLFLGGNGCGVRTFDISRPAMPTLVADNPEFGSITSLSADGNLLYLSSRSKAVVATVNGGKIQVRSQLKIKGHARLIGSVLYYPNRGKFVLYDLTDPARPVKAGELDAGRILGAAAPGQLWTAGKKGEIALFDVRRPQQPVLLRTVTLPVNLTRTSCAIWNKRLFLIRSGSGALQCFDLSGTQAHEFPPVSVLRNEGEFEIMPMAKNQGSAVKEAKNGFCFLFTYGKRDGTLHVLSAVPGDAENLDFVSDLTLPKVKKGGVFRVNDVFVSCAAKRIGNYLLAGDGVVDITHPLKPRLIQPATRLAASVRTENGRAFLAQKDRISILDISHLPNVRVLGVWQATAKNAFLTDAIPRGDVVYVINRQKARQGELTVLSIRNVAQPSVLGTCAIPSAITAACYQHYLYVPVCQPNALNTFGIVDIANPKKPVLLKTLPHFVTTACYRIRVRGHSLFLTDSMRGIREADLRDPLAPRLIRTLRGSTSVASAYTDFEFFNDRLYGLRHSRIDNWKLENTK